MKNEPTPTPAVPARGRLIEADGLRGIAAVLVTMAHAGVVWGLPQHRDAFAMAIHHAFNRGVFTSGVDMFGSSLLSVAGI